jgi:hypothetical protein
MKRWLPRKESRFAPIVTARAAIIAKETRMGKMKDEAIEQANEIWDAMNEQDRDKHLGYVLEGMSAAELVVRAPAIKQIVHQHLKSEVLADYIETNMVPCPDCRGNGCSNCNGEGEIFYLSHILRDFKF